MQDLFNLAEKVVVITGAGKGIGRETCKVFAGLDCRLGIISRNQGDLDDLLIELGLSKEHIYTYAGDAADPAIVRNFVAGVIEKFGKVDVLINNAGIRFRRKFLDISYEEWQSVINVNLGSTFLFCQEVGRHMLARKSGKIINMASVIGTLALPDLSGYAASKGGIISLTKALALEWAEDNITVNVIAPGFCSTSYADKFRENLELYKFTLDRTPMRRWGEASDIANACVFLASDMSSYVTGEVMSVDGGWSAW
jgi:NAD(P)-dependent dehydrogenase (short-subunit alcohol dehydrogenase family)